MAAIPNSMTRSQGISTLDVLWAFYLSQPKRVKKAFLSRLESQEKQEAGESQECFQWETDLKEILSLKKNWDEEGAPKINRKAISLVKKFVASLDAALASSVRLFPTHLGAIMLKYETKKGRINCEMGDCRMSYFLKRPGLETEYHSFEDINNETLAILKTNILRIA